MSMLERNPADAVGGSTPEPIQDASRGWQSVGAMTGFDFDGESLVVTCGVIKISIAPDRAGMVRVRLAPTGTFARDYSWAVVANDKPITPPQFEEPPGALKLYTEQVMVRVQRAPCRISFHHLDGSLISADDASKGMAVDGNEVRCWKTLHENDHFFGMGERAGPLDKRGFVLENWNHDSAENEPYTDPLYQSHPFFMVFNDGLAHGYYFDNTFRSTFDFGKTSTTSYSFGAPDGELNYYFIPGPTPADVVRRYGQLVGRTPLPPLWALGYQQCRWSYESDKRVRNIAKKLRDCKIPCDVIYMDIDYMDGYRCFTWHPERFSNPRKLLKNLRQDGFKPVVIIDPGILVEGGYSVYDEGVAGDHFCKNGDGDHYLGKVWPGTTVYPDYTRSATRDWWGSLYKGLIEDGIAGFWNDMNEPADFTFDHGSVSLDMQHDNDGHPSDHRSVHNIYGMQMARGTYEGVQKLRPDERPFVLTRAGFSGVQRYAAVWTGDNLSSWDHLRCSIPMLLNMGLTGIAMCGADIGGFRGHPSPELYTRWLQVGAFYPFCRTHNAGGMGNDAREQDPTAFGKKYEKHNRAAIELRYRLMPYIYTQMRAASASGLPLMRPVLLDFPRADAVHKLNDVFMFGPSLFVAPVVYEGVDHREIRLPAGDWYEYETGRHVEGGTETPLRYPVKLSSIPMFARAGAVIPTRTVTQYVDEKPLDELILRIYPGIGGGTFYNDDGRSHAHRDGEFLSETYAVDVDGDSNERTFRISERGGIEAFVPQRYLLAFYGVASAPQRVQLVGNDVPERKSKGAVRKGKGGWYFDAEREILYIGLHQPGAGDLLRIC